MNETRNAGPARVQIHLSARAAGAGSRPVGKDSGEAQPASHAGWREELAKATREVFEIMVGLRWPVQRREAPRSLRTSRPWWVLPGACVV